MLLQHVLQVERSWLIAHDTDALDDDRVEQFKRLSHRRHNGEPMAYLVGFREFMGHEFQVKPGVLIPRPDTVVLVDEAYIDFGGVSAISLVNQYPNLLVTQTLSKSRSLAGLRVGLAVGHPDLIEALERIKNSFNSYPLDRLAIAGAAAAFEDKAYFQQTCRQVIDSRERVVAGLQQLGFEVLPSAANFVFARHPHKEAAQLAAGLREQGVIVRHFKQPRIEQFLRISIGDEAQNSALLDALRGL